jgi:hypothetical protein
VLILSISTSLICFKDSLQDLSLPEFFNHLIPLVDMAGAKQERS